MSQDKSNSELVETVLVSLKLMLQYGESEKEIIQCLARNKIDLNQMVENGYSIMQLVAGYGKTAVLEYIVKTRGVDINSCTGKGSALHAALEYDQTETAKWLIKNGINIMLVNQQGLTASEAKEKLLKATQPNQAEEEGQSDNRSLAP